MNQFGKLVLNPSVPLFQRCGAHSSPWVGRDGHGPNVFVFGSVLKQATPKSSWLPVVVLLFEPIKRGSPKSGQTRASCSFEEVLLPLVLTILGMFCC